MKIKKYLLRLCWVAVVVAITVSCNKDGLVPETNKPNPDPSSGTYNFTIAAGYDAKVTSDEVTTHATLNLSNGVYYWDQGDRVGLFITETGVTSPVLPNIPLTATHLAGQVTHAIFDGSLSPVQIGAMSSTKKYNYYSYFPYNLSVGTFPNIQFQTPSSITVSPNTFKPANMDIPMVAVPKTNQPPVIYLDGVVTYKQMLHFDYKHVMSYAAIEMDCRLMPDKVTSITITNNSSTPLYGAYNYDMLNGSGSFAGGSGTNVFTINISGGLTAGGGDVIYIPMPPVNMSGQTLTLKFNTGTNSYTSKTIYGVNFERGKIHHLRITPPAKYEGSTSFTTTIAGYYYIEGWGGNGGAGYGGREGGTSQKIAGLYYLSAGSTVYVYVGSAGTSASSTGGGTAPAGGSNGGTYGTGGNGGNGGTGGGGNGGKGGAGGAGTFIFLNGTSSSNIRLVSGGGGGGGGHSSASFGSYPPGIGGNGGTANNNGSDGYNAGGNQGGNGGNGNGNGGDGGGNGGPGGNAGSNGSGGYGADGQNGSGLYSSGSGGGGGGGGYTTGGGGAESGGRSVGFDVAGGGGGGAGGASFLTGTTGSTPPGYVQPTNTRLNANGYVVITFFR